MLAAQDREGEEVGNAYAGPCELCGGRHLVVDELGRPYRPEWFSDRFERLVRLAGLPVIRLHDTRHTCGTLMHRRGVTVAVISAWLGHASPDFTMRTYVHAQNDSLVEAGQTLGRTVRPRRKGKKKSKSKKEKRGMPV
jgi:integrase